MEPCDSGSPTSVTTADAGENKGVQAGVVMTATSTSPALILEKPSGPCKTQADAVTVPGLAATLGERLMSK